MNRTLGAYELLEEIGRGGMGHVYRARHGPTGAIRAVKLLDGAPDPGSVARFRLEAEALGRADGPGVVRVHEIGVEGRQLYFAMDLMAGGSLAARLKARGRIPWREAVALVSVLARALERCHANGLVHRDVKPDNVLFDEEDRPGLADFGCVRDVAAASLTETGTAIGTPAYMAPEQLSGEKVDARADVYSLGVILHELISGERPYAGRSLFEIHKKASAGARKALGSMGPQALEDTVATALAPGREDRFESAALLAAALDGLGKQDGPGGRGKFAAALLVLALAAGAVGLAVHGGARGKERPAEPALPAAADPFTRARDLLRDGVAITASNFPIEDVRKLAEARSRVLDDVAQRAPVYGVSELREIQLLAKDAPGIELLAALAALAARPEGFRADVKAALAADPSRGMLGDRLVRVMDRIDTFCAEVEKLDIVAQMAGGGTSSNSSLRGLALDLEGPAPAAALPAPVIEGLVEPVTRLIRATDFAIRAANAGAPRRAACEEQGKTIRKAFRNDVGSGDPGSRLPPRLLLALEVERQDAKDPPPGGFDPLARRRAELAGLVESSDPVLALAGYAHALSRMTVTLGNRGEPAAIFDEAEALDRHARKLHKGSSFETRADGLWAVLSLRQLDAARRERLRSRAHEGRQYYDEAIVSGRAALNAPMIDVDGTTVLDGNRGEDATDLLRVLVEAGRPRELDESVVKLRVNDPIILTEWLRSLGRLEEALAGAENVLKSELVTAQWDGRASRALVHAARGDAGARKELETLIAHERYAPTMATLEKPALEEALRALAARR